MTHEVDHRRFIIVRGPDGREHRLDITNCPWCGEVDTHICALCGDRAENLRRMLKPDV